jgi:hypothetical protein
MTHDNSLKPVLHLRLGARPAAAPTPTQRSSPPRDLRLPVNASPPSPPPSEPITWGNYRRLCEAIPPPSFDVKTATAEQWASYNAGLSKYQLRARSFRWVAGCCAIFAFSFGAIGEEKNGAAFKFATSRSKAIFAAFRAGRARVDVVAELASEFEAQKGGSNDLPLNEKP